MQREIAHNFVGGGEYLHKALCPAIVYRVCAGADELYGWICIAHYGRMFAAIFMRRRIPRASCCRPPPQVSLPTPQYLTLKGSGFPFSLAQLCVCSNSVRRITIVYPVADIKRRHRRDVCRYIRLRSYEPAEKINSSVPTSFGSIAVVVVMPPVYPDRALFPRADAVAPVVDFGKATARPAQHGRIYSF